MQSFKYTTAKNIGDALEKAAGRTDVRFLAGGTNLVDLMKSGPERPAVIIDINGLESLRFIRRDEDSGQLHLGALTRMSDAASDMTVRSEFPAIAEALLLSASGQLRSMATLGGNLLQRTRCLYFRDRSFPCNKREPGSGCGAIKGENRNLAVLGTSEHCIASYAGDFAVALASLDGIVHITGPSGERTASVVDFYRVPAETPHIETVLAPGELVTQISLPFTAAAARSHYLKLRDRASFEFASVSVAAAAEVDELGVMRDVRIALGGLATRPWRVYAAEQALLGHGIDDDVRMRDAAEIALEGARPETRNGFKIAQARAAIPHAFRVLATMSPIKQK